MKKTPEYNTDINIIGSIPDYQVIYRTLELAATTGRPVQEILEDKNEFDFRTERSRDRFLRGIRYGLLPVKNDDHGDLILSLYKRHDYFRLKGLFLLWQLSVNSRTVFEITKDVFFKYYFAGKVSILQKDIVAYLKDKFGQDKKFKGLWTEETIRNVARKYLSFMTKIGLVEGTYKKTFIYFSISSQELAIFCYLMMATKSEYPDILKNPMLEFSFLEKGSFVEKVKDLAKKGWLNMSYNGVSLKIEPSYSYKEITDVVYN